MDLRKKKFATTHGVSKLKRTLKTSDLILLGLSAIVGTGIFVVTGTAASEEAGPALILSFIIAAIAVIMNGFSYAEFSSRIPVSGGSYNYVYVIFGEFIAWFVSWFTICEYVLAGASVAAGWSAYMQGFLTGLNIHMPTALSASYNASKGSYVDIIAVVVTLFVTWLTTFEAKKALRLSKIMVFVKFTIIILFVVVGVFYIKPGNWQPFMPFGTSGVMSGAALVFFAFLGFESIAMASDEVIDPQKTIPKGIIGAISISAIFYIIVTLVLTGIVPYTQLNVSDPVAFAMRFVNQGIVGNVISVGAIMTLLSVLIALAYGLSRMIYSEARDGLLPKYLTKISKETNAPRAASWTVGILISIASGLISIESLAKLTNIVTLAVLVILALALISLRKQFGEPKKGQFRVPFVPLLPILSIVISCYLMIKLPINIWIAFLVWIILGVIAYYGYGYSHSKQKK